MTGLTSVLDTEVSFEHERVRKNTGLHGRDCRNTLTFAHTTSRILPTSDMSLGSLTVAMLEARDFVETFEPYLWMLQLCVLESGLGIILNRRDVSKGNRGTKVINKIK